ncbi:inner membrane localized protein [Tanacetum coccineum]
MWKLRGHNRKGCKGQGGASQADGSSQQSQGARQAASARNVSSQVASSSQQIQAARQVVGARNASSQAGGSSQQIKGPEQGVGVRNASSQAAGSSEPSATPSQASHIPSQHSARPTQASQGPRQGCSLKRHDQGLNKLSFAQSRVGNVTSKRTLSIQARYSNDGGSNSGSAFIGGFVLGGVLVGTLGAIFAPQISKALAGTDKKELLKKLPNFIYDEEKALESGVEMGGSGSTKRPFVQAFNVSDIHHVRLDHLDNIIKCGMKTRQKLAQKIAELNSAIDDVSSQLKSDDDEPANGVVPDETEALA